MKPNASLASLLTHAQQLKPAAPEQHGAWQIFLRGIEHAPFEAEDLDELLADLAAGRDHLVDELRIEHLGDELRVSFLDDSVRTEPGALLALLRRLAALCGERG